MFCKNCGAQLSDTTKFCPKCGTQLSIDTEKSQATTVRIMTDSSTANTIPMTPVPGASETKTYPFAVWKLVSGIISLVLFFVIIFQSCAASLVDSLSDGDGLGGAAGMLVAFLLMAGGIISIAARKSVRGGNIALIVLFGNAAVLGFVAHGIYEDLMVWAFWCAVCAVLALISLIISCASGCKGDRRSKSIAAMVIAIILSVFIILLGILFYIGNSNN